MGLSKVEMCQVRHWVSVIFLRQGSHIGVIVLGFPLCLVMRDIGPIVVPEPITTQLHVSLSLIHI